MRVWCLCILLLLGCEEDQLFSQSCELPCYTGDKAHAGVGACAYGTPVCDTEHNFIECVGEGRPSEEVCDKIDNDCDGVIDEVKPQYDACGTNLGICHTGDLICETGEWVCRGAKNGNPEVCDKIDNDCDGAVDEEDELPVEFCYTGPPESILHPPCHPGVSRCRAGTLYCEGQTVPEEREVCGDRVDNNCDGVIDERLDGGPVLFDIAVLLDGSGSMRDVYPTIKTALLNFADQAHPEDRFWLLEIPGNTVPFTPNPGCSGRASLPYPSCNATDFKVAIGQSYPTRGGIENSYDAIWAITEGILPLQWRPGTIRVIVFIGDEVAQTGMGLTGDAVADSLQRNGYLFIGFVNLDPVIAASYAPLASASRTTLTSVSESTYNLLQGLERNTVPRCEP